MHVEVQRIQVIGHVRECFKQHCSIVQSLNVGFVSLKCESVGENRILDHYIVHVLLSNIDGLEDLYYLSFKNQYQESIKYQIFFT